MADPQVGPDRGALTGAMISAGFGVAWAQWAASGLSGAASGAVRIAGLSLGLLSFFWAASLRGAPPRASPSQSSTSTPAEARSVFRAHGYWVVVASEIVAIGVGNSLLGANGHGEYVIAWTAVVVGVHFIAFGRLFWAGFYWLGAALIAAGVAGATLGLAGGSENGIVATTGLASAVSLFAATGWTLVSLRAAPRV